MVPARNTSIATANTSDRGATRSGDLVARVGGDEFAVLLPHAEANGVRLVISRLIGDGSVMLGWNGDDVPVRFSVGGAAFPTDGTTHEAILQQADDALYRAKRNGKRRMPDESH